MFLSPNIPSGFRGIKEWGSPIFILCVTSNKIQNNVMGNQISVREIIECTEKDDYWLYRISSKHYLPPLYVPLSCMSAARELCDGHFDPSLPMNPLPLVHPPQWLGTGCSSH